MNTLVRGFNRFCFAVFYACGFLASGGNAAQAQTAHGIAKSPQAQEAVAAACEKGGNNSLLNVSCAEIVEWLNAYRPGMNIKNNAALATYIRTLSTVPCPAGNFALNREVDGKILHETTGHGWKRDFRPGELCLYDNNRGEIQFSLSCWNSPYEILSVASAMPVTADRPQTVTVPLVTSTPAGVTITVSPTITVNPAPVVIPQPVVPPYDPSRNHKQGKDYGESDGGHKTAWIIGGISTGVALGTVGTLAYCNNHRGKCGALYAAKSTGPRVTSDSTTPPKCQSNVPVDSQCRPLIGPGVSIRSAAFSAIKNGNIRVDPIRKSAGFNFNIAFGR